MTNIVGGNTGNLSQAGAGKDNVAPGFAQNSTGLDFFELISFATKNQEFSNFDGKGNNLTIENSDDIFEGIDLNKLQSLINVASNFKDIEKLTPKHNTDLTLNAVLDGSGENMLASDVTLTSSRLIDYISALQNIQTDKIKSSKLKLIDGIANELENYISLNANKKSKASMEVEVGVNNASQLNEHGQSSVAALTFLQNGQLNEHKEESSMGEAKGRLGEAIKIISFDKLKNSGLTLDLEKFGKDENSLGEIENVTKIYLNSEELNGSDTSKTGTVVEVNVKFNSEKIDIKFSKLDEEKSLLEKSSTEIPQNLVVSNSDKESLALDIEIQKPSLSAIFLNIDTGSLMTDAKAKDLKQVFLRLTDGQSNAEKTSSLNIDSWISNASVSNGDFAGIQSPSTSNFDQKGNALDPKLLSNLHLNYTMPRDTLLSNGKPDIVNNSSHLFQENLLSLEEKDLPSIDFLNNVKEKIKVANDFLVRELAVKNNIEKFIEKSAGSLSLQKVVSNYFEKEFGLKSVFSKKSELFMSTSDVLSFRMNKNLTTNKSEVKKIEFSELSFLDFDDQLVTKEIDVSRKAANDVELKLMSEPVNKVLPTQSDSGQIRVEPLNAKLQSISQSSNINRFSVLDAQFASRMASAVLEQAINSKESFDLILEPESFGKIRVNVSLESLQLELKLSAENTATLAILRASETVLQSITELNGLKLAEYSVELSNNAQNNSGSKEQKENSGQNDRKTNDQLDKNDDKLEPFIDEGSHSLNLIA